MLTEAIGERFTEKTSSAKHKFVKELKNTKNVMGSWTNDTKTSTTKKLKNVRSKLDSFSLKRNKNKKSFSLESDERPKTFALGNDEMLQSLSFNSPLNNRCRNLENIPAEDSTYEIPKKIALNRSLSGELPSYEQVVKDLEFLKRNTNLTQSLYNVVHKPNNLDKNKNISDSQLHTISSESSDENESEPPDMKAPELPEQVYGRIKKLPSSDYENAPIIPLRKPPPPPIKISASNSPNDFSDSSDKATICGSDRSLDETTSSKSLNISTLVDRSESWRYVSRDNISQATVESVESTEPIYANDENERMATSDSRYAQMFPAASISLLTPQKVSNVETLERKSQTLTRDILNEFDPLSRESFDAFIMTKMNHLSLLETLLSEETYGSIDENYTVPHEEQIEENSSIESMNAPTPPERDDSLVQDEIKINNTDMPGPSPKAPSRQKKAESRAASVIIHQNLKLKGSVENLAEPYLAKFDDESEASTSRTVDLSRPKPPQSSWFVEESDSEKFKKNNLDNPNNFPHAPTDKLTKSIHLPKVNNLAANRDHLPTYEESKNDEIVNIGATEKAEVKPKSSIFHFGLKRKPSMKEAPKFEEKDFIPRPQFSEDPPHAGDKSVILFKLPSGVIEDMLKELNPRFVEVKKRQFKAYSDSEFKVLKEHLDFSHLSSIQYLINHKFAEFKSESGRKIYCFELNLAVPKNSNSPTGALLDSKGVPVKTQRVTYVYGIHSKNEK